MPLSHSFTGGAVVDEREPKANNRRKKQLKRANEAAGSCFHLSLNRKKELKSQGLTRRQALAIYGSLTDKKATDPRRRNKKKAVHARKRDRDCKLDVLSAPCPSDLMYHAPLFVYPDSRWLHEGECLGEERAREMARENQKLRERAETFACEKVGGGMAGPLERTVVKVQNRGLLNVALNKVRELVHDDVAMHSAVRKDDEQSLDYNCVAFEEALAQAADTYRGEQAEESEVDEKLEQNSNNTSAQFGEQLDHGEKSDVSSESSWTMA